MSEMTVKVEAEGGQIKFEATSDTVEVHLDDGTTKIRLAFSGGKVSIYQLDDIDEGAVRHRDLTGRCIDLDDLAHAIWLFGDNLH